MSDLHFGDADPKAISAARDTILELKPDVVAVSGDLTQSGHEHEFAAAAEWLSTFPLPLVVAPGNHDAPVFNLLARLTRPKQRYKRLMLSTDYAKDGVHVRAFDTARPVQMRLDWSQGVYDLRALKHVVEETPGRLVLVAHHAPITPPNAPVRSDAHRGQRALMRMRSRTDLVLLTGHTHKFFAGRLGGADGPTTIVSPSLASSRRRGEKNGFVLIKIDGEAINTTLYDFDGETFGSLADVALTTS